MFTDLDERIMKQQQEEEERKRQRKEKKKEKKVSAVLQHKSPPVFIFQLKIITNSLVGFENQ
jgi:U4/U6.U5 tri-snRNP component SNU23